MKIRHRTIMEHKVRHNNTDEKGVMTNVIKQLGKLQSTDT